MLPSTIGTDQKPSNPNPYSHSTYADGQQVSRETVVPAKAVSRKELTAERLIEQKKNDLRLTAGRLREVGTSGRTDRKWTSQRPNGHYVWDCIDDGTLNLDAHQEALAVLDAWKFAPWKGAIFGDLIWIEETTYSGHWELLADQPAQSVAEPCAAPYRASCDVLYTKNTTKEQLNKAYDLYQSNPEQELSNLRAAMAAYAPQGNRMGQAARLVQSVGADFYLQADDILSEFTLDLIRRFDKGQYNNQAYPLHTWIAFIWCTYFFPGVQTKVFKYLDLTTFMNPLDKDDIDFEIENHTVLQSSVELEMARREVEGYKVPISGDKVLRELENPLSSLSCLSPSAKMMLRAIANGATKAEAAEVAGVSERHGRRILSDALAAVKLPAVEVSL